MKTDWTEEKFSGEPLKFVKLNDSVFLQRKNIRKADIDPEYPDSDPGYICESRKISLDVYEDLMSELESPAQTQSNNYQLDILEALTDLYEMLGGM